jgi:hypothetical protein
VTPSNSRLAAALAVVVMALSVSTTGQVPGQPQVGTGLIAGQVVDADTGRGIAGVPVVLVATPAGGQGVVAGRSAAATDSQGRFVFAALASGQYMTLAQAPGYASVTAQRTVDLKDGARITDIRFLLRKRGSISGVVRDDSGGPVVGVEVLALRRLTQTGRPPTLSPIQRVRTDDRGVYRLGSLEAGEYLICACNREPIPFDGLLLTTLAARPLDLIAVAGRAAVAGAGAVALEGPQRTLPPTFHPNTPLASQAERVTLGGGQDKTAVDVSMTATTAARISGRIVGAPSSMSAAFLRLRPLGDLPEAAAITQMVPMLVQPDGRFDFANVPPGQYVLEVNFRPGQRGGGPSGAALAFIGARGAQMAPTAPPGPGRGAVQQDPANDPLWASELISVGPHDITDLVIGLNRSLTMSGRLQFVGSAPQPTTQLLQRVAVQLLSVEMGTQIRTYSGRPDEQGRFEIRGILPGRYALGYGGFAIPAWSNLKSITAAGEDITDTLVEVTTDVTDLLISASDVPAATITGQIALAPNEQSSTLAVRLFPAERRYLQDPFGAVRRFKTSRPTATGSFNMTQVPAGDYFIVVGLATDTDVSLETLDALAKTAQRIRVNDADTLVVEVRR